MYRKVIIECRAVQYILIWAIIFAVFLLVHVFIFFRALLSIYNSELKIYDGYRYMSEDAWGGYEIPAVLMKMYFGENLAYSPYTVEDFFTISLIDKEDKENYYNNNFHYARSIHTDDSFDYNMYVENNSHTVDSLSSEDLEALYIFLKYYQEDVDKRVTGRERAECDINLFKQDDEYYALYVYDDIDKLIGYKIDEDGNIVKNLGVLQAVGLERIYI